MSHTPYDVKSGRVPIAELGAYAQLGKQDGWGIYADVDGMVEVRSPFSGLTFEHLSSAEQDKRQTHAACAALRRRDREIHDTARSFTSSHAEYLADTFARRAGAALWLFQRDLRLFSHACAGHATGWTLHPMCRGYNSDAHEADIYVGTRTGQELDVRLRVHVLEGGVFRCFGYVDLEVRHDSGATRTVSTFSRCTAALDRTLHVEMVTLARRLAEAQYEADVVRAQARLDHLRGRLALV